MNFEKAKKIYLGIDLGTNSCGWAVTDEKFNLLKKGGQHLWGIRLFDEAKTSKERRGHREQRRRIQRTRWRICLLREIMDRLISDVDPDFYERLDYSSIFDSKGKGGKTIWHEERHYSLFNDPNFKDKEFFNKYPTIYHLRWDLINTKEEPDPRFVYLAFHNIIKNRGNFLDPNESSSNSKLDTEEAIEAFNEIDDAIKEALENSSDENNRMDAEDSDLFLCDDNKIKKVNDLFLGNYQIKDTDNSSNEKYNKFSSSYLKEALFEIFGKPKSKSIKEAVINLIVGGTAKGSNLFADDQFSTDDNFKSISFDKYDEKVEPYLDSLNDDQRNLIIFSKKIYDSRELIQIIGDNQFLSEALVKRYNEHNEQLKWFKKFIKDNFKDKYSLIFRKIEKKEKKSKDTNSKDKKEEKKDLNNYAHYIL